jgi:hypothetical protein
MMSSSFTFAQNYERNGNTFEAVASAGTRTKQEPIKTKFTWKDTKGVEYPVYVTSNGACFVIKTSSKTGKEYKAYLPKELCEEICKEMDIKRKEKK